MFNGPFWLKVGKHCFHGNEPYPTFPISTVNWCYSCLLHFAPPLPLLFQHTISFLCISYRNAPCAEKHSAAEAFVSQLLLKRMTCSEFFLHTDTLRFQQHMLPYFWNLCQGSKFRWLWQCSKCCVCISQTRSDWHRGVGQTGSRQICVMIEP